MDKFKKHKIGNGVAAILISIAGIFDLLTLIPVVGDFLGPIFWVGVSIYFWKVGMGFVNTKRLVTEGISLVAELIPAAQALPTMFVGMIIIVGMTRFEEKTGISVGPLAGKNPGSKINVDGTRMPPPRTPIYQGEFRPPNGGLVG